MTAPALRDLAAETLMIPARAAVLLLRHLPQLVTTICLGLAGRQAVVWIAVWVSSYSSLAASLIMPLAPLSVMLSIIVSLWLLRPSLPFLSATFPDRAATSTRVRVLSAGGMLISFLTVYATHGLLKEDLAAFRRAVTNDEYFNQGFDADFSRAFVDDTAALIALIAGTVVLRKVIGYFALAEKGLGFTYLAAYLEVLWMTTVSVFITNRLSTVQDWALSRRGLAPAHQRYEELKTDLSEHTGVLGSAWDWLAAHLPALNQLVTIPVAWLTLGAVIFGTTLAAKEAKEEKGAPEASTSMRSRMRKAARGEAKHALDEALQPVAGPIKTTWKGLRTLARAGLVPMTVFCIVFMLATSVEIGVVELGRMVVGPQDSNGVAEQVIAYILVVARAVYLLVVVCLIASGLDYFLRRSYAPAGGSGSTKTSGAGSSIVT